MLEGNPVNIDGIVIPSDHPVFLAIIGVHVLAGLTCIVAGIVAMLSRKARGRHTKAGSVYYISMWFVYITACMVAFLRWAEDYHLFILGVIAFTSCFLGRRAYKKRWHRWPLYHVSGMAVSFIFLLIAFYVDNGKFLPLWKEINPVWYWLLPVLVGIPLLLTTLHRNPMTRGYFKGWQ